MGTCIGFLDDLDDILVCECFWQDLNLLKLQEHMQHAGDASAFKQAGAVETCAATWLCLVLVFNMRSTCDS